jgi:hypothetical protein
MFMFFMSKLNPSNISARPPFYTPMVLHPLILIHHTFLGLVIGCFNCLHIPHLVLMGQDVNAAQALLSDDEAPIPYLALDYTTPPCRHGTEIVCLEGVDELPILSFYTASCTWCI